MNVPQIYKKLVKNSTINEMLGLFEFELCEPYLLSSEWPISLTEELVVLAEDGSGGAYAIQEHIDPDQAPVIFLSSEGRAGTVATNLTELLAIMTALPYWADLLKFSADGKLEEMRKAIPFLDEDHLEDDPEIHSKQRLIAKALDLPVLSDPVQALFNSVTSGMAVEIKASDGSSYESLFNSFSVGDNPFWQC